MFKVFLVLSGIFLISYFSFNYGKSSEVNVPVTIKDSVEVVNFECERTVQYELDDELTRAINLYFQRITENNERFQYDEELEEKYKTLREQRNCLKVVYVDSDDTLAYFLTNENLPNTLNVYFSKIRKTENDIDNSILLAHELDHAAEMLLSNKSKTIMPACIDVEVSAEFAAYHYFTTKLNKGEFIAVANYPEDLSDIAGTVRDIGRLTLGTNLEVKYECQSGDSLHDTTCFNNGIRSEIKKMLESNPKYSNVCK